VPKGLSKTTLRIASSKRSAGGRRRPEKTEKNKNRPCLTPGRGVVVTDVKGKNKNRLQKWKKEKEEAIQGGMGVTTTRARNPGRAARTGIAAGIRRTNRKNFKRKRIGLCQKTVREGGEKCGKKSWGSGEPAIQVSKKRQRFARKRHEIFVQKKDSLAR